MGNTKLAAFAMNAHTNNSGNGLVCAFLATANTAGVSTTAAASFDKNVVTTTPTRYTSRNNLRGEPCAWLTASVATQSKRPSRRPTSDNNIMPIRKR